MVSLNKKSFNKKNSVANQIKKTNQSSKLTIISKDSKGLRYVSFLQARALKAHVWVALKQNATQGSSLLRIRMHVHRASTNAPNPKRAVCFVSRKRLASLLSASPAGPQKRKLRGRHARTKETVGWAIDKTLGLADGRVTKSRWVRNLLAAWRLYVQLPSTLQNKLCGGLIPAISFPKLPTSTGRWTSRAHQHLSERLLLTNLKTSHSTSQYITSH